MRTRKWKKIARTGRYSVFRHHRDHHLFEVSWKQSSGSYARRRFNADSLDAAIGMVPLIMNGVSARTVVETQEVTLVEAFKAALAQTRRGEASRREWLADEARFLRWLVKRDEGCTHWKMLTRQTVREYIAETLYGRSANRIRLALQPITQTAGWMAREHRISNVTERLGIGCKLKKTPPMVTVKDVCSLLDWLREHEPRLEAGAALAGLAGLAVMECLRLTWEKVDLENGLIEVSGEVKNEFRKRVIPICSRVQEALLRARESRNAEGNEYVVVSPHGCSYIGGIRCWSNYCRRMSNAIRSWNPKAPFSPKDLRNCLPTLAVMQGVHNDLWEQYLGHAPRTVTAKHYVPRLTSASLGENEALVRQMSLFRLHVVEVVEQAIEEKNSVQILNNFERRKLKENEAASGDLALSQTPSIF